MREILFRGQAANRIEGRPYRTSYKNGDWVYGLLTDAENYAGFAEMTNTNGVSGIEVDKNTVGQFTGLTDKNGKKIFEGDILVIWNEYEHPVLVKFLDFGWHCVIPNVNVYIHYRHRLENNTAKYEVIGNIHDNPELLEADHV